VGKTVQLLQRTLLALLLLVKIFLVLTFGPPLMLVAVRTPLFTGGFVGYKMLVLMAR
jgi:hypothetical protein